MAQESTSLSTPAQAGTTQRLPPRRVFMPRTDIFETNDGYVMLSEMPGVDSQSLDVTLEKDLLTITGKEACPQAKESEAPAYAEFECGDYRRTFSVPDAIDRDAIKATLKNGLLKLYVPKAGPAKMRKIAVKSS